MLGMGVIGLCGWVVVVVSRLLMWLCLCCCLCLWISSVWLMLVFGLVSRCFILSLVKVWLLYLKVMVLM